MAWPCTGTKKKQAVGSRLPSRKINQLSTNKKRKSVVERISLWIRFSGYSLEKRRVWVALAQQEVVPA
jgi:hypothetical protein